MLPQYKQTQNDARQQSGENMVWTTSIQGQLWRKNLIPAETMSHL